MKVLNKIFGVLFFDDKVNVLKTIYANFVSFRIIDAIKFPILIYGKAKVFIERRGCIQIDKDLIKKGLIVFGRTTDGFQRGATTSIYLSKSSLWKVKGKIIFNNGCNLSIRANANFETGNNIFFGPMSRIFCLNSIYLGDNIQFSFENQVLDSNFHYILNICDKSIRNCNGKIVILNNCWIGNSVGILKGTYLPDGTIVASNSFVNQNYSTLSNILLAGIPAKIVTDNVQRVFSRSSEILIRKEFINSNSDLLYLNELNLEIKDLFE